MFLAASLQTDLCMQQVPSRHAELHQLIFYTDEEEAGLIFNFAH
jgi:hypothetical protein